MHVIYREPVPAGERVWTAWTPKTMVAIHPLLSLPCTKPSGANSGQVDRGEHLFPPALHISHVVWLGVNCIPSKDVGVPTPSISFGNEVFPDEVKLR